MSEGITKSQIVRVVSEKFPHVYIKDVQQVVDTILEEMVDALASENRVEIRGFGALSVRKRKARKARNPRTNAEVDLGERFTPYFRAGKELRDRLNKPE